jgi:D-alanyl-lipoteichoic acid acyltransferase DltB (MBOAT superfamily)
VGSDTRTVRTAADSQHAECGQHGRVRVGEYALQFRRLHFRFLPAGRISLLPHCAPDHLLAAGWLVFASLFFYGWWNPRYVLLLVASIGFNYACGFYLARLVRDRSTSLAGWVLAFAVTANLALLAYYKYANFFLQIAADVSGHTFGIGHVLLPLGISFFTFTQIAFLVDVYRGPGPRIQLRPLRAVRHLFPAPDRRSGPAS